MKNGFLLLMLLIASTVSAQEIRVHDPVAIKQGDTYYLFCTGRGISVFSSPDLKNWEREPQVFTEEPVWADGVASEFNNHIWAPDITFYKDKYYLYYSVPISKVKPSRFSCLARPPALLFFS